MIGKTNVGGGGTKVFIDGEKQKLKEIKLKIAKVFNILPKVLHQYGAYDMVNVDGEIIGFVDFDGYYYKWDGSQWIQSAYNSYYRARYACVTNSYIYLIKGDSSSNFTRFDKSFGNRTARADIPYGNIWGMAVLPYNNEVHIFGCNSSDNRSKHYKFTGSAWTSVSTLPQGTDFGGVGHCLYAGKMHAILSDNSLYRWSGSAWTKLKVLPGSYSYRYQYSFMFEDADGLHIQAQFIEGNKNSVYSWNGTSFVKENDFPFSISGSSVKATAVNLNGKTYIQPRGTGFSDGTVFELKKVYEDA